ncbi:hypothetical protein SNOG_06971 [Parastagonospora nodorum SN15]|uniref:Uncharacterized protein n=1 Tax=Phaeosphaeria nodorum (strain SN15 / ATCC MYA-4574 / FGSC 10173) TaxID=321614 RepID=Q0UMP3_PHANO|nr:hypothetical protein SNOG_06971 [Parastagonospora nodorum SN15]EAT85622.2 hypothetical protein SNOG_06971 [Parastagonospora nodorum SN15]
MAFGQSPGKEFFNSWALWQKMTFVVTVFLGLLKLWYDTNKLKKYSKVDKGKRAVTPEMLEAQPVTAISVETKDDVPFGIRAIQSGIEVDGVWISRTNTPAGSSRNSISEVARSYNNSQLELPQAAMYNGSSRNSSRAPSSSFDRAVSAEPITSNASRSSSQNRQSTAAPSHRMSHVAETGQLTPRVRKPGNSGDWASVADNQTSSANGVSYFMPQKTPSPPYPAAVEERQPAASHYTQDGHASNDSKQGIPLMESYAPRAAYLPDTYQPKGPHHQYSYDEVPYEVNTEQNQRESQILRKVNSGFEIMRPGTFAAPTPEELELAERQQHGKKLQKKRRSSETRRSAFVESV